MGNITDKEQHERDVRLLNDIAEALPEYRRHLSHHLRNPLSAIMGSVELARRESDLAAVREHLDRIMLAVDHICADISEAGL